MKLLATCKVHLQSNYVVPIADLRNKLLQGYITMIICDRLASTLRRGRRRRCTSGQLTVY